MSAAPALLDLFRNAPPLAQLRRDLAASARNVTPVLDALVEAGGALSPEDLARRLGQSEEDVRSALFLLEARGLVESSRFRATPQGMREARA